MKQISMSGAVTGLTVKAIAAAAEVEEEQLLGFWHHSGT